VVERREGFGSVSKTKLFQTPWNFLGLPDVLASAERARAWVLPIPFESTTSYGAGTRDGPAAIITASRQVEFYDRELDGEPALSMGIHTLNPLAMVHSSPKAMLAAIEEAVARILNGSPAPQILGILGGEHTITSGAVRGLARHCGMDDLVAVQIDAHADLRDEYQGSRFSHACAARRILETCPIFQVGVRSISAEEEHFRRGLRRVKTVFADHVQASGSDHLADLAAFVRGKTVYLTIDLDGLDPSIMPAVGTPEPGGLSWEQTLDIVRVVCGEADRVPVFDIVELAPVPGLRGPDFLAAKLTYKIMCLALLQATRYAGANRKAAARRKRSR
jgi:agmatinase